MKLGLSLQTLAQHYIKTCRWGRTWNSGYLHKHSYNTTLKAEVGEESETQVIFIKTRTKNTLKREGEEEHETQVIFTKTRTTLH